MMRGGEEGIREMERLYRLGIPELMSELGSAHIFRIPETAAIEMEKLLSSEGLSEKWHRIISGMLNASRIILSGGQIIMPWGVLTEDYDG